MNDHFDRIEQFITDVTLCVETSRDLCQRLCQDLRPLLAQPWPPRAKPAGSGDPRPGNHGDAASSQEAEALADVERTLAKAQRARELQRRLNPLEDLCPEDGTKTPGAGPTTQPAEPASQVIDGQEFAVISRSSLKKLFADVKPRRSSAGVTAPKPRPGTAQARAAYGATVSRPKPPATSRFKTTSSEIGRSVAAKSAANAVDNKKAMKQHKVVTAQSAGKEPSAGRTKRSWPNTAVSRTKEPNSVVDRHPDKGTAASQKNGRPILHNKRNSSAVATTRREKRKDLPNTGDRGRDISARGSQKPAEVNGANLKSGIGMGSVAQKTAELRLSEGPVVSLRSPDVGDCGQGTQDEGTRLFMLKRDGHSLKVPGKLKKIQSDVSKLRQRLSSRTAAEEQSRPSQHFRLRLESKSSALPPSSDVQERLVDLQTDCSHLMYVAQSAMKDVPKHDEASGDSKYQLHVLSRALRTRLDALKGEVETRAEAEKLSVDNGKRGLPLASQPCLSDCCTQDNVSYLPSPTFYLPVQGRTEYVDPAGRHNHQNYEYSHLGELQRLAALQHDVQRLGLQIQLEKLIAAEMLPILETLDASDNGLTALYRCLYGLLCHGGQLYPAVIADSLENASELETT